LCSFPPRPPSPTLFPYTTLFRSKPFPRLFGGVQKLRNLLELFGLDLGDVPIPPLLQLLHGGVPGQGLPQFLPEVAQLTTGPNGVDRKSTRLNSSHVSISYAVFCL